ncbi:glycine-rich domain-containing protein [Streptomyces alanosinicus]|uniref:Glycine-rich domain-containing protein n=1 Tax=Streptomyces alanosinicus TaxID=68171 RepID=A0A918YRZ5_9ACTN|nr:hypothetical protein [Streptomyces alanosinicus]GHE12968.1 hypothetical protein GCM10010339_78390 [Streptomyces alanosinicus]
MDSRLARAMAASSAVLLAVCGVADAHAQPKAPGEQQTKTYAAPGTFTFKVPDGVTKISVAAVGGGGGGGGGGGAYTPAFTKGGGGGGGGSAGAVVSCDLDVTSGSALNLSVGIGGKGGGGGTGGWIPTAGGEGGGGVKSTVDVDGSRKVSADWAFGGEGAYRGSYGGYGGKAQGIGEARKSECDGSNPTLLDGRKGKDGGNGDSNRGGWGGGRGFSPRTLGTCDLAGQGGEGGKGGDVADGPSNDGWKGVDGQPGCIVLAYTTNSA